jgi:hypothetical protein
MGVKGLCPNGLQPVPNILQHFRLKMTFDNSRCGSDYSDSEGFIVVQHTVRHGDSDGELHVFA